MLIHNRIARPGITRLVITKLLLFLAGAVFSICTTIVLAESIAPNEQQISQIKKQFGNRVAKRIHQWKQLIENNRNRSDLEKLQLVNRFINTIRFIEDRKHWGKLDYWATPIELLVTNGGDCEDLSIAKYFTLREMGISADKMRLIYVKATSVNQAHMILAYYQQPDSEPLILDNLDKVIKLGSERTDLIPVYSFNGDYLWLSQELKGRGEMVGSSTRISLWNRLRKRMERQKRKIAIQH